MDRDFAIGRHRSAPVRRLRRAPRPLRLWRHLRARPPDRRREGLPPRRARAGARARRRRSCAIPAATSSPATTGRTASARSRSGRARLDLAWFTTEPNTFGTNEFIDWCRAAEHRADAGGQPRHPRRRRRAQPRRVLQPSRRHRTGPTCAASTAGRSRTTSSSGAWATRWMAPGRWSTRPPPSTASSPRKRRR